MNRLISVDREYNVVSHTLQLSLIEYKTLVVRGDMEAAAAVLPNVPMEQRNQVARFLEAKGLVALALEVSPNGNPRQHTPCALNPGLL